jgi:hypothetical protein
VRPIWRARPFSRSEWSPHLRFDFLPRRPILLLVGGFIDKNQGSPPLLLGPSCLGCSLPAARSDPIITAAVAV